MHSKLSRLEHIRDNSGSAKTIGLPDEVIDSCFDSFIELGQAIDEASEIHNNLISEFGIEITNMDERNLIDLLQKDYVNFYPEPCINPYVALSAKGPWIVTSHGAVLHDNGGYGMLGMGHGPDNVISAMKHNWVMANVMTPSFSQKRLADRLRKEVGHSRDVCPFSKFVCMNSGSESVAISLRIADANAFQLTSAGNIYEGREIKLLALEQGFHGRTQRPAQISDSCNASYKKNLASFRNQNNVILIPANDISALHEVFNNAEEEGYFIELMAIEPVMGEGNPGQSVTREFYDEARKLCTQNSTMLLVDSIQAGIRGQGCLSIVDYPGFEDCGAPDMETWSKALNAGQYPLSVVGLSKKAAETYVVGIYGNTMTTNPRALETAIAVLDRLTPELRKNIQEMGKYFVKKLNELSNSFPGNITKIQGTGLLISAELEPDNLKVVGFGCVEEWCRFNGLGVIHGGENALRFTPHFAITEKEIDLIMDVISDAFKHFSK
ncbi:MAG TPA: aminotransferase class III-fold pyridoxal phosphate-dependent enzyme [Candidatus Poseidoniaceae archaeon]|jgi:acetylornithine/succinyldiaminopimelate/putrescine aminotransferase|nr:aminotransferase class III-fold pyridoxal phosphate-dependent enzyme [Candidatus Poseidoniaceae archaeon]